MAGGELIYSYAYTVLAALERDARVKALLYVRGAGKRGRTAGTGRGGREVIAQDGSVVVVMDVIVLPASSSAGTAYSAARLFATLTSMPR